MQFIDPKLMKKTPRWLSDSSPMESPLTLRAIATRRVAGLLELNLIQRPLSPKIVSDLSRDLLRFKEIDNYLLYQGYSHLVFGPSREKIPDYELVDRLPIDLSSGELFASYPYTLIYTFPSRRRFTDPLVHFKKIFRDRDARGPSYTGVALTGLRVKETVRLIELCYSYGPAIVVSGCSCPEPAVRIDFTTDQKKIRQIDALIIYPVPRVHIKTL